MENSFINSPKLKGKIVEAGHTYETLAEKIEMTPTAIYYLLKRGDTKASTLYKICKVLNCSIDEIMK